MCGLECRVWILTLAMGSTVRHRCCCQEDKFQLFQKWEPRTELGPKLWKHYFGIGKSSDWYKIKGFSTYVKYCFFNTETLHIFNLNNAIVKISQHIFKIVITVWWLPISFHIILWEPNRNRFFSFLVTETGAGNMVLVYFSDRRAIQERLTLIPTLLNVKYF